MSQQQLPIGRIKEVLSYNPETGVFTRLISNSSRAPAGEISSHSRGYRSIRIDGKSYLLHRVAFVYMTGRWPENLIDHIDGDIHNNKFSNLREVTQEGNVRNQRKASKNNKSGLLGAYFHKRACKWSSYIRTNVGRKYLGLFDTKEAAHSAYLDAKRTYHETCSI